MLLVDARRGTDVVEDVEEDILLFIICAGGSLAGNICISCVHTAASAPLAVAIFEEVLRVVPDCLHQMIYCDLFGKRMGVKVRSIFSLEEPFHSCCCCLWSLYGIADEADEDIGI